jgi:hypothetical protein
VLIDSPRGTTPSWASGLQGRPPGTPSPLSPRRTSARSVPRGRPSPRKVVLSAPRRTNDLDAGQGSVEDDGADEGDAPPDAALWPWPVRHSRAVLSTCSRPSTSCSFSARVEGLSCMRARPAGGYFQRWAAARGGPIGPLLTDVQKVLTSGRELSSEIGCGGGRERCSSARPMYRKSSPVGESCRVK